MNAKCTVANCENRSVRLGVCSRHHADVADGVTYRQLDHWVRLGYLHPEGGAGSGFPRQWPRDEWAVAALMGRLVKAGVTPVAAHRVARGNDLAPGIRVHIYDIGGGDGGTAA